MHLYPLLLAQQMLHMLVVCAMHQSFSQNMYYTNNFSTYMYILQIILPEGIPPRWGHSLTATSLAPGLTEVAMFGGCTKCNSQLSDDKLPMIADTAVLTLGEGKQYINTCMHIGMHTCDGAWDNRPLCYNLRFRYHNVARISLYMLQVGRPVLHYSARFSQIWQHNHTNTHTNYTYRI